MPPLLLFHRITSQGQQPKKSIRCDDIPAEDEAMHIRITLAAMAAVTVLGTQALAQDYPTKPVTLIVPYPPGGATDIIGRVLAQKLSTGLGQQFVVDNRSGAGGNIGAQAVASAKNDGYTLLMGAMTSHSINATLQKDTARFSLEKDFTPITIVGTVPLVLVVHPSVPANNLKEFIALAKAKPGDMTYASAGNGSPQHLTGEQFKLLTKTDMVHIPYKGSGPAMTDLMGGQVKSMIETVPAAVSFIKSNKIRPLFVTTKQRVESIPDVPTAAEAGMPGFEAVSMFGIAAPAGTPKPVIDRLNAELKKILQMPDVKARLLEQGVYATHTTPEQAATRIRDEVAKWGKVIKEANVKVE
jgi:tripartite-type tricarboxylate transporter receptor subunit TctC